MSDNRMSIGDLHPDPNNARKHNPRNIGMIADSLQQVGAARSIVIDEDDVILAGNGTVDAAGQAGIEDVIIVEADGNQLVAVRRRNLTDEQKLQLRIADNRTAELAEWDTDVLGSMIEEGADFREYFSDKELDRLLGREKEMSQGDASMEDPDEVWGVIIECASEAEQVELLQRFVDEGLEVRALL